MIESIINLKSGQILSIYSNKTITNNLTKKEI